VPRKTADEREQAERVAAALGTFTGLIFVASVTGLMWQKWAAEFPVITSFGVRLSEGEILLSLRKFEDLWNNQISILLDRKHGVYEQAEALVARFRHSGQRDIANQLVAHYAENKEDPPLSDRDVSVLIQGAGLKTTHDFLKWSCEAMWALNDVREALLAQYGLPPDDMKSLMKSFLERFPQT